MTKNKNLIKQANKLPNKPGIYTWINVKGKPVYIGSAKKSLKKRAKEHVKKGKSHLPEQFLTDAKTVAYKVVQIPKDVKQLEKITVRAYNPTYNKNKFY